MSNATFYLHKSIKTRMILPSLITPVTEVVTEIQTNDSILLTENIMTIITILAPWFEHVYYYSAFYR